MIYVFLGAGVYWGTDIAIQWSLQGTKIWIFLLTFFVPVVVLTTYILIRRKPTHAKHPFGLPLFMLFGIWMFGPLAIAIGVIPHGGTFLESGHFQDFLYIWVIFPATTFMMATYSGSLGGLLLTSVLLIIFATVNGVKYIASKKSLKRDAANRHAS